MALHSSIASVCVSTCRRAHTRESASYKLCTNSWIGFTAFPNATLVLSFKVNLIISISSMTCFHLLTCCNLLFLLKSILKFFIWHSLLFFLPCHSSCVGFSFLFLHLLFFPFCCINSINSIPFPSEVCCVLPGGCTDWTFHRRGRKERWWDVYGKCKKLCHISFFFNPFLI